MPGFTLGESTGGTLGGQSGGTLGGGHSSYLFDDYPISTLTSEVSTHRTLTLSWRVPTSVLTNQLRDAKTDENQIDVLTTDSGGFTSIDRSGGENTYHLSPPERRRPLRQPGTYHVSRYEETLVSQSVDEWDVEIEFTRNQNRADQPSIEVREQVPSPMGSGGLLGEPSGFTLGTESGATLGSLGSDSVPADWWRLETRYGVLATQRVDAEFLGTGSDGVERFELVARFTREQAHVFEAALSRLDGVRVRQVSDGTNRAVDDTSDDANTISVRSPTEDVVRSGEYVAMSWESSRVNDAYQEVRMEIAVKG